MEGRSLGARRREWRHGPQAEESDCWQAAGEEQRQKGAINHLRA